jgi:hypothetical protein
MIYNGTSWVNSIVSGDATLSNAGTLTIDSGTSANKIVRLDGSAKLPAVDGSALTNLAAGNITGTLPINHGGTAATSFAANAVIVSNGTGSALQALNCTSGQVITFDASGYAVCGSSPGFVNGGNSFGADATLGTNDNKALKFEVNNTTAMTISQNGWIGIGTAAPNSSLHIGAGAGFSSSASKPGGASAVNYMTIASATSGASVSEIIGVNDGLRNSRAELFLADNATTGTGAFGIWGTYGGGVGALPFVIGVNDVERLRIDTSGRVGINTSNPSSALDVSGAITAEGMSSAPAVSASHTGRIYFDYAANKFKVSQNGGAYADLLPTGAFIANGGNSTGADISIGTTDNKAFSFMANNTTAMTISQGGNVGIGTASPTDKLNVAGNTRVLGQATAQQNVVATGATVDFNNGNVQVLQAPGGSAITLNNMVDGGAYTLIITDATSRTYTFTNCTNSRFQPSNAATTASKHTIYTILKVTVSSATWCYINWSSDY